MTDRIDDTRGGETPTQRRDFIGKIAASAMVIAGTGCASTGMATHAGSLASSTRANPASTKWDNSWFDRLTAPHKAVFDCPELVDDTIGGPGQATRYINGLRDALGVPLTDVQTVVVIRHKAIPFAFNDAMWEKYPIGELLKLKDGEKWLTKNPVSGRGGATRAGANDRPQANATWLAANGHILLGCDLATNAFSGQIASKIKGQQKDVYEDVKANLVSGLLLQPNGVYAMLRAQEGGCVVMRST